MRNVRTFSKILYLICKAYGWLALLVAAYTTAVLLVAHYHGTGLLNKLPDNRFTIAWPLTHKPFLIADFNFESIAILLGLPIGYGVFSLLLGDIFKVFRQEKLFTTRAVDALTKFYVANLILPSAAFLIAIIARDHDIGDFIMLAVLHCIIAVFAWFMANIFKQGLALQDEQDHTL
jgi:hypothetical protein